MAITVEEARDLARGAHAGHTDKAGAPYFAHPCRVAARLTSDDEKIVALLHDVLEDTTITESDLATAGVTPRQLEALRLLTHPAGEEYTIYVRRIASDPLAAAVKRADIEDNTDPERLARIDPVVAARLRKKYERAAALLDELSLADRAGEPGARGGG